MNEQESARRQKLHNLRSKGFDPYSWPIRSEWCCTGTIDDIVYSYKDKEDQFIEDNQNKEFILAGRVVSIRQPFLDLRYGWSKLQAYVKLDKLNEDSLFQFENLDTGDWVAVRGKLFKTQKGELTLRVEHLSIVSKCLNPFFSSYYGMKDEEQLVKNRVGRLLVDKGLYDTIQTRSEVIHCIRNYLHEKGYIEIETPILETTYGGANAVPFVTHFESLKTDFFLRIAPELALKKAIIAGFPKVFELGKVFRNEGMDSTHNPEFTTLEIYTINNDNDDAMKLTESLIKELHKKVLKQGVVIMNGYEIDLEKPFRKERMDDLVKDKTGVNFFRISKLEKALEVADKFDVEIAPWERSIGHIFQKLFDKLVVPELIQPTFVYGFHRDVSPLAKSLSDAPDEVSRYELYIGGMEFSNGFSELNDPDEQRKRFEQQVFERQNGNKEAFDIDESYLFAMQYGLPPTGGIGIGIDRLVMLFTGQKSIKNVMFLPSYKK